jgi:4-oxalocrotonate tautomerase family enzyme
VLIVILKERKGLSIEQKRRIVREFTETLVSTTGVKKKLVTILIEELALEDIGKAGKLRLRQIPFGYSVIFTPKSKKDLRH